MSSLIKRLSIFVAIFAVVAIATTCIMINHAKSKVNDDTPQSNVNPDSNIVYEKVDEHGKNIYEDGIDILGFYDENDLIVSELIVDYNGLEIYIPQISGLKDRKVQDKINSDMKSRAMDFVKASGTITDANFSVFGNFANVLSICYHANNQEEDKYNSTYFNYELVNGNRLDFEDLFVNSFDVNAFARNFFYEYLAQENYYEQENNYANDPTFNDWENLHIVASVDENELYKYVNGFVNSKEKNFGFDPQNIYIRYGKVNSSISFMDIHDIVAIYNRFLTKNSLYTNDNIGKKNIINCSVINTDYFDNVSYGYLEDNLWYDITDITSEYYMDELDDARMEKFVLAKKELFSNEDSTIETYRALAKSNPDKVYIVLIRRGFRVLSYSNPDLDYWVDNYTDGATFTKHLIVYEVPKADFDALYRDGLYSSYRLSVMIMYDGADPLWPNFEVENSEEVKLYNYVTLEEIDSFEKLFTDVDAGMSDIKNVFRNYLVPLEKYSDEKDEYIDDIIENAKYSIRGDSIIVEWDENSMYTIYFSDLNTKLFRFNNTEVKG